MHLNYNLGSCPSGYSSLQKVSPLYVLNFPKIRVRVKITLPILSPCTNLLYDGLLRSQILFT